MSTSTMNFLAPVTVCMLLTFSGTLFSASAQDTAPAKQAQKPAAAPLPPDPLRGPKVEDAGVPGENRRFGGPSKDRKDRAEPAIPHRAFVRALENMQNSNPDGSLKLNAEQRQYVKKVEDELKSDVQAFVNDHRDEIAALPPEVLNRIRQTTGVTVQLPAAAKAKPRTDSKPKTDSQPGTSDAQSPMDDASPMQREEKQMGGGGEDSMQDSMTSAPKVKTDGVPPRELARELIEKAPKPADYHAKVWQVLSEPQRVALKQELVKYREEAAKRGGNANPAATQPQTKPADSKPENAKPENSKQAKDSNKKSGENKGKDSDESGEKSKAKRSADKGNKQPTIDSFRGKDGKIDIKKLPPRLQERLANLSDEELENALKELEKQRKKN